MKKNTKKMKVIKKKKQCFFSFLKVWDSDLGYPDCLSGYIHTPLILTINSNLSSSQTKVRVCFSFWFRGKDYAVLYIYIHTLFPPIFVILPCSSSSHPNLIAVEINRKRGWRGRRSRRSIRRRRSPPRLTKRRPTGEVERQVRLIDQVSIKVGMPSLSALTARSRYLISRRWGFITILSIPRSLTMRLRSQIFMLQFP